MKDTRQIFADPKGFQTYIQKRQARLKQQKQNTDAQSGGTKSAREDKENMTFAPKLDISNKTKGMKDERAIFLKPKGADLHV